MKTGDKVQLAGAVVAATTLGLGLLVPPVRSVTAQAVYGLGFVTVLAGQVMNRAPEQHVHRDLRRPRG